MVVNNFNGVRSVCLPTETDTPLVVDADGVLAFAVAFEGFQSIAGRNEKLIKFCDGVKLGELAQGGALNVRWEVADFLQPEQAGGGIAGKGSDHALSLLIVTGGVKVGKHELRNGVSALQPARFRSQFRPLMRSGRWCWRRVGLIRWWSFWRS